MALSMKHDGKRWTHDKEGDLWYFDVREDPKAIQPVAKTVELGPRMVNLDYDENGQVTGVEVL